MEVTQRDLPMNWHKFLIYFALWAGGILSIVNGVRIMTGNIYGLSASQLEFLYGYYAGLKVVDVLFGIFAVLIGAFTIYTRFQLAGFKEGAPNKLTITYVLSLVFNLAYNLVVAAIVGLELSDFVAALVSVAISSGISIVMLFVNRTYYNNRAHLFGNCAAAFGENTYPTAYAAPTYTPSSAPADNSAPTGKFCPTCGAAVTAEVAFCQNCGAKLQ